jgi:PTH1 family peptidyl-tRNA hydrolase
MKVIVGLGNPGPKYQTNRHNIGFMAIDRFASSKPPVRFREEFKSLVAKVDVGGTSVLLVKPQTFMNLSGEAVQPLLAYYKLTPADLLVLHDELDLPFLALRYQTGRGHGGHNGIRSIHAALGTDQYDRLKIGIGRPVNPQQEVASHVLEDFSGEEQTQLGDFFKIICSSLETYLLEGHQKAASLFNRSPQTKKEGP